MEDMTPVSLRLPPDLWERCDWQAKSLGLKRPDFVRSALEHATRDAKPPRPEDFHQIGASAAEWQAWKDTASHHGVTIDELITRIMRKVTADTFASGGVAGNS